LRDVRWTEELYWNWLNIYRALIQDKTPSYPNWMRTTAWKRKELQTMFGSWVDVRHDAEPTLEFAQTIEPGEESGATPPWGYVEPQPETYARLAALTRMIIDGLESRLMLSNVDRNALLQLETWLIFLQDVSRRELTGQALTTEEYQRLAEYGSLVEELNRIALGGKAGTGAQVLGDNYQIATAIRVAAAQETQRIEALGRVDEIYVVVERDREQYLARGGIYSHYELTWPSPDPLVDVLWQEMLASDETPPRPEWVRGFVILE
jgi:hypothetical protein